MQIKDIHIQTKKKKKSYKFVSKLSSYLIVFCYFQYLIISENLTGKHTGTSVELKGGEFRGQLQWSLAHL